MSGSDTIFAQATAPGKSGVAVLRISGGGAAAALAALGVTPLPKPRMAALRTLNHQGDVLDQALVLWFPAPHSFTGEDVAELHLHGSRAVMADVMRVLLALPGLRPAEAGEFSRRAFENHKLDLTRLEGLADAIEAETTLQRKQAMAQLQGHLQQRLETWRQNAIRIMALLEAYIDFPDEDLPEETSQSWQRAITQLADDMRQMLASNSAERIRDGITIAILGAPNAGKSSLLNALAGRDIAIVSQQAGTTRDVLEVQLDIAGFPVTLLDTAGLRESADIIEQEGIRRALTRAEQADICLILQDGTMPDASLPAEITRLATGQALHLRTKADLPAFRPGADGQSLAIATTTGQGLDAALNALTTMIQARYQPGEGAQLTRQRHRHHLNLAAESLLQAAALLAASSPYELPAEELRLAARHLGRITGHIDVEEVLGEIFSSFCIGK